MAAPELVAHRGWTRRYPENTLAALRGAVEAGARHVEVDVQLSADRVPFLCHDAVLDRICGVPGRIAHLRAEELARLRASEPWRLGARFADEPLARLADLVQLQRAHPAVHAFVEIKHAAVEAFGADAVLDAVLRELEPIAGRWTLISFDVGLLQAARGRGALPLGPVLTSWEQREDPAVAALRPAVVFCDVERLPPEGALAVPGGRLAVYEIDQAPLALALHARGAALIETFAVGELLEALRGAGA